MSSVDVGPRTRPVGPAARGAQLALGVLAAVIASVAVNALVAWALSAVGGGGTQFGLAFTEYAPLTAVGVVAGAAGWAAIRRFASRPRSVLRVLVPAVVLVSFVPDLLILTIGATLTNVAGLMVMHLAVATVAVTGLVRVLPLPTRVA